MPNFYLRLNNKMNGAYLIPQLKLCQAEVNEAAKNNDVEVLKRIFEREDVMWLMNDIRPKYKHLQAEIDEVAKSMDVEALKAIYLREGIPWMVQSEKVLPTSTMVSDN